MPRRGSDGRIEFWLVPEKSASPFLPTAIPYRLKPSRVLGGYYGCFEGIVTPFGKIAKKLI